MDLYIKEIADRMVEQDNLMTSNPYWVVLEDHKIWNVDDGDHKERKDDDCGFDPDDLCDDCYGKFERGKDLPDTCGNCDDDAFNTYRLEQRVSMYAGIFFTYEGCMEHIAGAKHHYDNPRPYAYSFSNNHEMRAIQAQIIKTGRRKAPDYYR